MNYFHTTISGENIFKNDISFLTLDPPPPLKSISGISECALTPLPPLRH